MSHRLTLVRRCYILEEGRRTTSPAAHAKQFATEFVEPALMACTQAMGANGLKEEFLLGHRLTAARVANYVDGSTEIMTDRIAKSLRSTYT